MSPGSTLLGLACAAAFVAYDAFRHWHPKRFVVALAALVLLGGLSVVVSRLKLAPQNSFPSKLQQGFGPEWDCNSGSICIRKPQMR